MILEIQILLILIFTGIAVITDLKTGHIPNWITYTMIGIGGIINAIFFPNLIMLALAISIIIYIFGICTSKKGMGGGDIKLYIGINMILPLYHNYLFILYVMLISNILGFIYMRVANKKTVRFAPYIFTSIILLIIVFEFFLI